MGLISALVLLAILFLLAIFLWKNTRYFWPSVGLLIIDCVILFFLKDKVGGSGNILVIVLLSLTAITIALLIIWLSYDKHERSRIKIRLAKAFTLYKYDYRESWLGFNSALNFAHQQQDFYPQTIKALANIVNSPSGKLWTLNGSRFGFADHWNSPLLKEQNFTLPKALIEFIQEFNWVVDSQELKSNPQVYTSLVIDLKRLDYGAINIFIPLRRENELVAIVGLESAAENYQLNWEDHDLLKAAGQQMASYLGLYEATSKIYEQRQLEAFNRVSTFVVHDIKNVSAQLELISQNANKFGSNPEFIQDTYETIDSAISRLRKMLNQLQRKDVAKAQMSLTSLKELIAAVELNNPDIKINSDVQDLKLIGIKQQLADVILHLDENAREAVTAKKSDSTELKVPLTVEHRLEFKENDLYWHIVDQGIGMDERFIRDELYKPFHTTKGSAGMGIGVYQCRYLLRSFEGDLIVRSQVGQGTHCTAVMAITTGVEDESK